MSDTYRLRLEALKAAALDEEPSWLRGYVLGITWDLTAADRRSLLGAASANPPKTSPESQQ